MILVAVIGFAISANAQTCTISGADDGSTVEVQSCYLSGDKVIVNVINDSKDIAANDLTFDENNFPKSSDYLFMDGGEIFNFTSKAVPELVENVLAKNNLKQENIDLFVFHQANKFMINYLRKSLDIEKDKFFVFMENVGNTVSSTIPIALYEAQKQGILCGNILLAGFGVGYSWGATVISMTK